MTEPAPTLVVDRRYRGPPGMANGGYACGLLAARLQGADPAEVTLRRPVPLDRPLGVRRDQDGAVLVEAGVLVAEARPAGSGVELAVPGPVTAEAARAAAGSARYYDAPYFPECFVCGPLRGPGDGLRIFAGPLAGRGLWAAPWTPDPSVAGPDGRARPEVVWAALDCPSGIAAAEAAGLAGDTPVLLGRMTAGLAGTPRVGDACQVVAWLVGRDGRKLHGASALLDPGGAVLAAARTIWLTVARPAGPG